MIVDTLENADVYAALHPGIATVLEHARTVTPQNFPTERRVIDGDRVFLNFANYETMPIEKGKFEAHHNYIDVMCMIEGCETIYVKNTDKLSEITVPYVPEKDCLFAALDSDSTPVRLEKGMFCILFPQDAHCPGQICEKAQSVKKIIGKVKL